MRPDLVLLHPRAGIAVYEVKDWNLTALGYCEQKTNEGSYRLLGKKDGRSFEVRHPLEQVMRYKREIHELYCPRLAKKFGYAVITAGVIFPFADDEALSTLFRSSYKDLVEGGFQNYYPLVGCQSLASGKLQQVFPEGFRRGSKYMSPELAQDLRCWLVEPDIAATQRRPLELDANQKRLITTRTSTGYRRIKGPAGSGKSAVLAARAAQLASEGKEVLVVTYNITLFHMLMDMAARWPVKERNTRANITWLNFHHWCKRTCEETGFTKRYKELWARYFEEEPEVLDSYQTSDTTINHLLSTQLPALVEEAIQLDHTGNVPRYDAIIVDEGQDFLPEWWSVLRKVGKPSCEMLLAADSTQDVYGTAGTWTEQTMHGAGFDGPWAKLPISYRMPTGLIQHASAFAKQYLPTDLADLPIAEQATQMELDLYPCQLRWVQTSKEHILATCVHEILSMPSLVDPTILAMADITFLSDSGKLGKQVAEEIEKQGVHVIHTFAQNNREARRRKLAFFMGDARMKATTLHSFKGWETRALVLYVGHAKDPQALAAIYTGITRLKRHTEGSFLTVVCAAGELEPYGRRWPQFERSQFLSVGV